MPKAPASTESYRESLLESESAQYLNACLENRRCPGVPFGSSRCCWGPRRHTSPIARCAL